jgi:hypothetical protein
MSTNEFLGLPDYLLKRRKIARKTLPKTAVFPEAQSFQT